MNNTVIITRHNKDSVKHVFNKCPTLCAKAVCARDVTWLCILLLMVAKGELVELRLLVVPGAVLMIMLVALGVPELLANTLTRCQR